MIVLIFLCAQSRYIDNLIGIKPLGPVKSIKSHASKDSIVYLISTNETKHIVESILNWANEDSYLNNIEQVFTDPYDLGLI